MKCTMKKNMTALAMSVAVAAGTMGYMAAAQAGTADYSNTITISSEDTCQIDVSGPQGADAGFNATWTGVTTSGTGVTTGTLAVDADTSATPKVIKLKMTGGSKCNLSTIHLTTAATGSQNAAGGTTALIHPMESGDGAFWRFVPLLASAKLYTDDNWSAGETTEVKFHAPDGSEHQQQPSAVGHQSDDIPSMDGVPGKLITNNSFGSGIQSALLTQTSGKSTIEPDDTQAIYQSAELGVGVALGANPETPGGTPDPKAVLDKDSVSIPFTVTVTAS